MVLPYGKNNLQKYAKKTAKTNLFFNAPTVSRLDDRFIV